jgi:hypothetical protein
MEASLNDALASQLSPSQILQLLNSCNSCNSCVSEKKWILL